jgi:sporulation protein YlmC with PRC-barrel domain
MSMNIGGWLMAPKSFHKEELVGKSVVDSLGNVRGKVKDVIFSLDGNVALIIDNMEGAEARIPLNKVTGISDYVVMRTDAAPEAPMGAPMSAAPMTTLSAPGGPSACKFCGTTIPPDTTYCPGCGRSRF